MTVVFKVKLKAHCFFFPKLKNMLYTYLPCAIILHRAAHFLFLWNPLLVLFALPSVAMTYGGTCAGALLSWALCLHKHTVQLGHAPHSLLTGLD